MSELPLIQGVNNYLNKNRVPFCMPGHIGGKGFEYSEEGRKFLKKIINYDITEVDGVDNLHHPNGIIMEAQKLLGELYGSKKSYFLVNGSTSGNLTMIFSSFSEKDKVIVERGCHRSINNGIILRKLRPVYIKNKINKRYNAHLELNTEDVVHMMDKHPDAKGIIITYPNYYGICPDLSKIILEAKKRNIKVLVDSAHGAHFGICEGIPKNAVELGADMVVMSAHKTLPSLNQGAFLHVNNVEDINRVDFYISAFLSTSPSYMIMCSMDYARNFLKNYGEKEYRNLLLLTNSFRDRTKAIGNVHIMQKGEFRIMDATRIVINGKENYGTYNLMKYLQNNGIQPEMCDGYNIVLITTPFHKEEDFNKLYEIIKYWDGKEEKGIIQMDLPIPEKVFEPYEVLEKKKRLVKLCESDSLICAESIVPYPPGIPLIVPGEKLTKEILNVIKYYKSNNTEILGLYEDKIRVI